MAVGTLAVNVVANTARAGKNLKSFRGDVKSTGKEVRKTGRSFREFSSGLSKISGFKFPAGGLAAGLGLAAAAVSFRVASASVRETNEAYNELAKTSAKLGIASDNLVGLRHAAEQTAGVTSGTLDTALQRMVRRIAEAKQGTGEAKGAISELGLDIDKLAKMQPDRQFGAIADAMGKVANQGDKVRLSMKLFDTEGVALVNTLSKGSGYLKEMVAEAKALGLAPTAKATQDAEKYADQVDRAAKAWKGVRFQLGEALTPAAELLSWSKEMAAYGIGKGFGGAKSFFDGAANLALTGSTTGDTGAGKLTSLERFQVQLGGGDTSMAPQKRRGPDSRAAAASFLAGTAGKRVDKLADSAADGFSKFGSLARSFNDSLRRMKRQAVMNDLRGMNPLTGLPKSTARRQKMAEESERAERENESRRKSALAAGRGGRQGLNSLLDAGSREGYLALRANQRAARNGDAMKAMKQTAKHAKTTATQTKATADGVRAIARSLSALKVW